MKKLTLLPCLIALLALTGLSACVSLASDITPPPDYTPPAVQAVSSSPAFPLVAPDPAAGAPIYAEKCAPCHGSQGQGDGPDAAKLSNPVAAIGQPDVARASTPSDWYNVITNGRLERFMPGFTGSLTDRQRWDVLAYVYTLSTPQEQLAEGQQVYQAECASCHGQSGTGDGPQAASLTTRPGSLADQSVLAQRSVQNLFTTTRDGKGEMPGYAGKLDDSQIWAVSAHLRSLTFAGSGAVAAAAAPEPTASSQPAGETPASGTAVPESTAAQATPAAGTGTPESNPDATATPGTQIVTISGKVISTAAEPLPADLTVTLLGYDQMTQTLSQEAPVQADGSYRFENVEVLPERVFLATVEYKGTVFNSDIAHAQDITGPVDLPIMVFESTSDPAGLSIDRMHVFFDFSNPGTMQVVELLIISNTGTTVVAPTADGQPVMIFNLPEGYTNLQFQDGQLGERFVQTPKGFGDLGSVPPGSGQYQLLFAYDLPYDRKLALSLPVNMPTGAAVIMVPTTGVKLASQQLTSSGQRDVQGLSFNMFTADNLAAGQTLDMTLSGKPKAEGASETGSNTTQNLIIGGGVLGIALAATGLWLFNARKRSSLEETGEEAAVEDGAPGEELDTDALIEAIAALDDQFNAGNISEAAYQERRAELKGRLRSLMNQQPPHNSD